MSIRLGVVGLFVGLGDALQCLRDFLVQDMPVSGSGRDVAMIERTLYDFQIARLAQEPRRGRMPQVVEAEVGDACPLHEPLPFGLARLHT